MTLAQIEKAISNSKPESQRKLLKDLPHLLKIASSHLQLLKAAEPSFDFWNNSEDIVYDRL